MNKEQLKEIATLAKSIGFKPNTLSTIVALEQLEGNIKKRLPVHETEHYLLLCEIQLWLLKEHDFLVEISRGSKVKTFNVFVQTYIYEGKDPKNFNSYQDALTTGILECLKLIKNNK